MMNKRKTASSTSADLRFISSLPLDEAVQVLATLDSVEIRITLTEIDADHWHFVFGGYKPGQKRPRVTLVGDLRRWQGTYTRLECTHQRHPASKLAFLNRAKVPLFVLLFFGVYGGLGQLLSLRAPAFVLVMIILLVIVSAWILRSAPTPASELRQQQLDRMFENIQRVFRLAGDVSQDESDLDASDDPGLNAVLNPDATGDHRQMRR